MKKLYVVNNGAAYSDNCTFLVEADPDEWDDLERVLLLCGDNDDYDDHKPSIDAVATDWTSGNTCAPCDVVQWEAFFDWADDKSPYAVPYDNGRERATHYYKANPRGITTRDAMSLWLAATERLKTEPGFHGSEWLGLFKLAIERGEFQGANK